MVEALLAAGANRTHADAEGKTVLMHAAKAGDDAVTCLLIQPCCDEPYTAECRSQGIECKKIVLTFAPCGRAKTIQFIKWLGINMPDYVERRILEKAADSKQAAVNESIGICCEALQTILAAVDGCGVPLGVSVGQTMILTATRGQRLTVPV